ncbi:MAG: DUF6295 family protein [Caldilineaceae bacterium]
MHNDRQTRRHRRQRQRRRRLVHVDQAYVAFDHPFNAAEHRVNLDFVNEAADRARECGGSWSFEAAPGTGRHHPGRHAEAGGYTDAPSGTVAVTAGSHSV